MLRWICGDSVVVSVMFLVMGGIGCMLCGCFFVRVLKRLFCVVMGVVVCWFV